MFFRVRFRVNCFPPSFSPVRMVPLRHSHPNLVHTIESSGAVVDMDMATALMNQALGSIGCDFHPLLIAEEKTSECERGASSLSAVVVVVVSILSLALWRWQSRRKITLTICGTLDR